MSTVELDRKGKLLGYLIAFYEVRRQVEYDSFSDVAAWLDHARTRPAVKRGMEIPGRGQLDRVEQRHR